MKADGKTPGPSKLKAALDSYRGLVILVNFNDRKFTREDRARQLVDDKMNMTGYTGYKDGLLGRRVCTGSVKDYFHDNSYGLFAPDFDVVGPVEVDVSQYYINKVDNTYDLARLVLETADADIDYSRYDSDGDGMVDMFYILYAGFSSSYSGNDERLMWPHAGNMTDVGSDLELDGMRFGRFACSSELFGWEEDGYEILDGIGVIVHEFSHVLGFKDHYDVSGYKNEDPGTWDVMAAGNYDGYYNDTPCGYSVYEKHAAGFLNPRTVSRDKVGERASLRPLTSSSDAIRIVSMQDSTVFLLENRQAEKWDKMLPGHGMLVWRVDSCDSHYWDRNAVNVDGHWHVRLVRAKGTQRTMWADIEDKDCDPFPGSGMVDRVDNFTVESNLLTDRNFPSPVGVYDIEEDAEGIVSLTLEPDMEAEAAPYIFRMKDSYKASGTLLDDGDETGMEWTVTTEVVEQPDMQQDRKLIYNLAPDTRGISATDPKYSKGLGATCVYTSDRRSMIIEPARVAVTETEGIWLVDLDDLEKGGSGAIVFDMNGYGMMSLVNPEARIGYVTMKKSSVVPVFEKVTGQFGVVSGLTLDGYVNGVETITDNRPETPAGIFNMQGLPVDNPRKGDLYIVNGRKMVW